MDDLILPVIGSSGYFELRQPLDTLIVANERYTCKAIRRLSDYLANNEVPKDDIYTANGLSDSDYSDDIAVDMDIVSLQADNGHWLYIPARFIAKYPIANGIPYRTVMIGISLPSLPVSRDLSNIKTDIENIITDTLGVIPVIKTVETSRVVLVSKEVHDTTNTERTILSEGRVTDRSRYMSLVTDHQLALNKIAELELYIKNNLI